MLDLFAGTGALGFEALSRGAAHATFVERDGAVVRVLRQHQRMLDADADIAHMDARVFLRQQLLKAEGDAPQWDVIFLDPPFDSPLLTLALKDIAPCLAPNGLIYVETDAPLSFPDYATHRTSRAGNVHYGLLTRNAPAKARG